MAQGALEGTRVSPWPRCRRFHAICYASTDSGVPELSSSSNIWAARSAVIGAVLVTLVTAMGLAGCGRKGGLGKVELGCDWGGIRDPADVPARPGHADQARLSIRPE